jgi:hypothetical protein
MALASHATVCMARFDEMRTTGDLAPFDTPGTLFRRVAADTRGAATEPASQKAFRFLMLGLHADEASAHERASRGSMVWRSRRSLDGRPQAVSSHGRMQLSEPGNAGSSIRNP